MGNKKSPIKLRSSTSGLLPIEKPENSMPFEMTDSQLVERHEQLKYEMEERDAEAKIIREEFADRLTKAGVDSKVVDDFTVVKKKMTTFPETTIEFARQMGAVKDTIDTVVLRGLVAKGIKVEGKQEVVYVTIQRKREKPNE